MMRFTIYGEPASKANSRKMVTLRGISRLIKSSKALDYERSALLQIPFHARVRLEGPVAVTLRIFYATERPDLDESLILDILQDRYHGKGASRRMIQSGVYRNDRQVRERHVYHAIDKKNPRADIEVRLIGEPPMNDLSLDDWMCLWNKAVSDAAKEAALTHAPETPEFMNLQHALTVRNYERLTGETAT